jgi:hypothetical protein
MKLEINVIIIFTVVIDVTVRQATCPSVAVTAAA